MYTALNQFTVISKNEKNWLLLTRDTQELAITDPLYTTQNAENSMEEDLNKTSKFRGPDVGLSLELA